MQLLDTARGTSFNVPTAAETLSDWHAVEMVGGLALTLNVYAAGDAVFDEALVGVTVRRYAPATDVAKAGLPLFAPMSAVSPASVSADR
jgi:hypothetical protein